MCFEHDSRPPVAPIAGAAVDGRRIELTSTDGTGFSGYAADATAPSGAGMLVLPDVRGLHPYYEELALRFAEAGIDALAVDYFGRTAGTAGRPADFDFRSHVDQTHYPELLADFAAAAADLRTRRDVRRLFSVGFCFGGRLAFLTATRPELGLSGAIGFYGPPVGAGRAETPAPADLAREMRCPVLGLFGGADRSIAESDVGRFGEELTEAGVEHGLVTYPDAPHSFFDRKADEFAAESADAWARALEFVRRLSAAG